MHWQKKSVQNYYLQAFISIMNPCFPQRLCCTFLHVWRIANMSWTRFSLLSALLQIIKLRSLQKFALNYANYQSIRFCLKMASGRMTLCCCSAIWSFESMTRYSKSIFLSLQLWYLWDSSLQIALLTVRWSFISVHSRRDLQWFQKSHPFRIFAPLHLGASFLRFEKCSLWLLKIIALRTFR